MGYLAQTTEPLGALYFLIMSLIKGYTTIRLCIKGEIVNFIVKFASSVLGMLKALNLGEIMTVKSCLWIQKFFTQLCPCENNSLTTRANCT